jgi:ElaB/YqjD/DUF883 family membrane-anchored ribosome-binding protein
MEVSKNQSEQTPTSSTAAKHSSTGTSGHTSTAPQRAKEVASEIGSQVQGAYDQSVKAVSDAYGKTSEAVTKTYDQAMTYGRDNPGKLTMIAFGAGIGVGVLLASGLGGRRNSRYIYTEPIVNALSQAALAFFRR